MCSKCANHFQDIRLVIKLESSAPGNVFIFSLWDQTHRHTSPIVASNSLALCTCKDSDIMCKS
jgi:hypothetical protein